MTTLYEPEPAIPIETRQAFETDAPVRLTVQDRNIEQLEEGVGLCLSGGGYRAMLFHLGALWRLNEAGVLHGMKRISSVSGGSITAAYLGQMWTSLDWVEGVAQDFATIVGEPIMRLAERTIDVPSILIGALPFKSVAKRVAQVYVKHLYKDATLQDFPPDGIGPRFILNATNLRTGVLWRFSRPYMGDYTVGLIEQPKVSLATAVAASAGFPPVLSPVRIKTENMVWKNARDGETFINDAFRDRAVLTDGGVYDNMGLETVFKRFRTVLVSDAGGGGGWSSARAGATWLHQFWRVFWIQRYQVGRVRRRQLIHSYRLPQSSSASRIGAYWGIGTDIRNYNLSSALNAPIEHTTSLRDEPTRLKRLHGTTRRQLVNWGYAVCDAAIRKHVWPDVPKPPGLPFQEAGVG